MSRCATIDCASPRRVSLHPTCGVTLRSLQAAMKSCVSQTLWASRNRGGVVALAEQASVEVDSALMGVVASRLALPISLRVTPRTRKRLVVASILGSRNSCGSPTPGSERRRPRSVPYRAQRMIRWNKVLKLRRREERFLHCVRPAHTFPFPCRTPVSDYTNGGRFGEFFLTAC